MLGRWPGRSDDVHADEQFAECMESDPYWITEHIAPGRYDDAPLPSSEGDRAQGSRREGGSPRCRPTVTEPKVTGAMPKRLEKRKRSVVPPREGRTWIRNVCSSGGWDKVASVGAAYQEVTQRMLEHQCLASAAA